MLADPFAIGIQEVLQYVCEVGCLIRGMLVLAVVGGCLPALSSAATSTRPAADAFGRGQAYFHPPQYAPYRFLNTVIRLHFDLGRGIVYGDETTTIRTKHAGARSLPFNTVGIHYGRVSVNGRSVGYTINAPHEIMNVQLPAAVQAGAHLTVDFRYWAQPQRGIYFVRPDNVYPHIAPQVWSQGEPTDNRRWFPTWDEPNEKTPSELIVAVPHGWTVVANGYLKAHSRAHLSDIWDWRAPKPMSTYLIAFAAGPLDANRTKLGSMDVDSLVPPEYAGINALCFGDTKDIVAYFQRVIGVAYPWEKYDQTTAERYTFGGMEDTSATILTTRALHPAAEEPEASCDVLISHELAQQWWGDDATMTDWANIWLHEGFATYYDELWSGQRFGQADFEYERYQAQQVYFAETHRYLRPIVDYVYADPLDMFDASSHQRPGEVLHMLRYMFGDTRFFAATRNYLRQYAYKNADTGEFFALIDKSLGADLMWFKREWFYRSDYPHYYVSDRYDASAHALTLEVKQKNLDGQPYRMPVVIEAFFGGYTARIEPTIDRNDQDVTIPNVTSTPDMVLFDPNNNILRQLTFPKPVAELSYQVRNAAHVGDREWALQQLAATATAPQNDTRVMAMAAVASTARSDAFFGVRADAVGVAGAAFNDAATVDAGLHDTDKRVRLAAEAAAANLTAEPATVIADLNALSRDGDPNLASGALAALGALKAPGVYDVLVAALNRPSFRQTVASGALRGLAALGDARALPLIQGRTVYGTQEDERNVAVAALAQIAKAVDRPQAALPTLSDLAMHDPLIGTRIAAATALGVLGDGAAIATLAHVERTDSQLIVRDQAANAVAAIQSSKSAR
jgi:aminopeptidase N